MLYLLLDGVVILILEFVTNHFHWWTLDIFALNCSRKDQVLAYVPSQIKQYVGKRTHKNNWIINDFMGQSEQRIWSGGCVDIQWDVKSRSRGSIPNPTLLMVVS